METLDLNSWNQLESVLSQIDQNYRERKSDKKVIGGISTPLYRGHADADWLLSTTLERIGYSDYRVDQYYRLVTSAYRYLSGFTDKKWDFDQNPNISYDGLRVSMPNYGFVAYLRHHGFPSPLLDWTASPYIALFFAFNPTLRKPTDRVALFCFQEDLGYGKASSSNDPCIMSFGPWEATHPRHHLQQCEYTVCIYEKDNVVMFASHEKGFSPEREPVIEQDKLVKITLPGTERDLALHNLVRMNVTPYSIFQSEDSLVETVSQRLFRTMK